MIFNRHNQHNTTSGPIVPVIDKNRFITDIEDIPLVAHIYTKQPFVKRADYVQLYYHGGGVYTSIALMRDTKAGIHITHGPILQNLLTYHQQLKKRSTIHTYENPFTGELVTDELRIVAIGTFVINDDATIASQVAGEPVLVAVDGQKVQLIDARCADGPTDIGIHFPTTGSFVEFCEAPNGDFIGGVTKRVNDATGAFATRTRRQIAETMVTRHLPNIQKRLMFDVLHPCITML